MRYFLSFLIVFFFTNLSQAQKNPFNFFVGIDYDISYSINDNFESHFVYNQRQYTNAGTAYLGIQKNNIYVTLGVTRYNRTLNFPCVAFEEVPPNQVQVNPTDIIIYDLPSENCEYSLYLEANFIEFPISIGYSFDATKQLDFFVEARYEPMLTIRSYRKLEDLMLNISYLQTSDNTQFHSWENMSIRGGLLGNIHKNYSIKLGVFLKSNEFEFDKMLIGGNVGLQYAFNQRVK